MVAFDLKNARDSILYAEAEDYIDDIEFVLLYDRIDSKEVYLYCKFHSFDLQCLTEFHITKNDNYRLADVLQIPMKITFCQRTVHSNIEGICILLKRLGNPY